MGTHKRQDAKSLKSIFRLPREKAPSLKKENSLQKSRLRKFSLVLCLLLALAMFFNTLPTSPPPSPARGPNSICAHTLRLAGDTVQKQKNHFGLLGKEIWKSLLYNHYNWANQSTSFAPASPLASVCVCVCVCVCVFKSNIPLKQFSRLNNALLLEHVHYLKGSALKKRKKKPLSSHWF